VKTSRNTPPPIKPPVEAERRRLRRILRAYHIRAFGEELARINFLPEKRRKAAVAEMIDHARRKGVKLTRPALGVTP
jgi:hypothetical protein